MIENYEENVKKPQAGTGTAFKPSYSMSLTDVSTQAKAYALRDSIKLYAGATLPDPGSSPVVTPASSSSAKSSSSIASSSSQAKSSSSVVPASSSSAKSSSSQTPVAGEASLTKHGSGSTTQTVAAGESIAEFYYTIAGATGATVTGLPDGVSGTLKGSDFYISGTVSATVAPGAYKFTVTTTGATTNASKSGTITVTGNGTAPASSSSAKSSSSVTPQSSDSETDVSSSSEASDAIRGTDFALQFTVSTAGRLLQVQNAAGNTMAIFDMQGRLLLTKRIATSVESALLPHTGTFILKIGPRTMRVNAR
jgi:pectate lyase